MESPTHVHEKTATMMAVAAAVPDGVDLISNLHDDLLQRILSFLPAASEVARTSVLSRRWRHLWSNAAALRFSVGSAPSKWYRYTQADRDEARRLIAVADAVLASRAAAGPDVQDLVVSLVYSSEDNIYIDDPYNGYCYSHYHAADVTSAHVASWLGFATRRVVGRFELAVPTVPKKRRYYAYYPMVEEEEDGEDEDGAEEDDDEEEEDGEDEDGAAAAEVVEEEEHEDGAAAPAEVEDGVAVALEEDQAQPEAEEEEQQVWQPAPEYEYDDEHEEDRVLFVDLPSSTRAQEMSLTLGKAFLTVPSAGAGSFHTLTDVLISHAQIDGGADGIRLGHLFSSSCCPRLRKLQLRYISGITELRLDAAGTLSELHALHLHDLKSLDVSAPGLLALRVNECYGITMARISAPRLEALACEMLSPAESLCFDGAASVRCIKDLHLSHVFQLREEDDNLSAAMWLLRHCTAMDRLGVELVWPHRHWSAKEKTHGEEGVDFEDNMMRIPQLPNMRKLKIKLNTAWSHGHTTGATITKILTKCPELEDLSIKMYCSAEYCLDQNCICNKPKGWDGQKISLERLRNVDFSHFKPYKSQIQLVGLLLTAAPALERMTLALHTRTYQGSAPVPFKIPCYGGCWLPYAWQYDIELGITVATKYEWTRVRREGEEGECGDLDGVCICNMRN